MRLSKLIRHFSSKQTTAELENIFPGALVDGFLVRQREKIDELGVEVIRFKHKKSGANYIHLLQPYDQNCSFGIGFKTVPKDSTGVAHILEHNVLCGSKDYPVRDPFFKMLNRSLSSYMNAYTAADHTFYPFSTENAEDYGNLRRVYFDACFHPLLRYEDFLQEGWRVDLKEQKIKGVVFNEMKGAMSDAEAIFYEQLQGLLFCGSTYGFNSGGDPLSIPSLSHENLVKFYKKHYTASNAVFVAYGNHLEDNLAFLNENLADFEEVQGVCPNVRGLAELKESLCAVVDGPIDALGDLESQHRSIIAWRTNLLIKHQETFHMQLLGHLLLDGPSAPLYQALIEAGLGSEFVAGTGYNNHAMRTFFGVGLQGMKRENIESMKKAIFETLERVSIEGFSRERIDNTLHQVQLSLKYKSASFGLNMCSSVMAGWTRGIYPIEQLSIKAKVEEFLRRLNRKRVLEPLIDKWLLKGNNNERVELNMIPNPDYGAKLEDAERSLYTKLVSGLSEENAKMIHEQNASLEQRQNNTENLDALPILKVDCIDKNLKKPSVPMTRTLNGIEFYERLTGNEANGISYLNILKKLHFVPSDYKWLPLALSMFNEFGIRGMSAEEYEEKVKSCSGGFKFTYILRRPDDLRFLISTYCLEERVHLCTDLLQRTINETDYEGKKDRLKLQILSMAASMSNALASSGQKYALLSAASRHGGKFWLANEMKGYPQALFIQDLALKIDQPGVLDAYVDIVKRIHRTIIDSEGELRMCVTSKSDVSGQLASVVKEMFPKTNKPGDQPVIIGEKASNLIKVPINTNYAAACVPVPKDLPWNQKAAYLLAAELIKSKFLHKEIREKGGAYGAGASFDHMDGLFSFWSYRDPSPGRSINTFKGSFDWLKQNPFSQTDLDEAKLSIFSSCDAPVDLAEEGLNVFKIEYSDVDRQSLRTAILDCTLDDIKECQFNTDNWSDCMVVGESTE